MTRMTTAAVAAVITLTSLSVVTAQSQRTRVEPYDPSKHHQDITLRISPDQAGSFILPTSNSPIRMDISAAAIGSAIGEQPNPIVRSATVFHSSVNNSIFFTDGNSPALALDERGVTFGNQPGADGIKMAISIALSPKGVPRQIEVSSPQPLPGLMQIEVRIALWY